MIVFPNGPSDLPIFRRLEGAQLGKIYDTYPQMSAFIELNSRFSNLPEVIGIAVRGSISKGTADRHSDIDLVVITTDEDYSNVLARSSELISTKNITPLLQWVDTIVPDFGGVGQVFLLRSESSHIMQLDLYVLPESRAKKIIDFPEKTLVNLKRKLCYDDSQESVIKTQIVQFVSAHDILDQRLKGALILAFILAKDILRDDKALTAKYLFDLEKEVLLLIRTAYAPGTEHYGFYDFLSQLGVSGKNVADNFLDVISQETSASEKFKNLWGFFLCLLRDRFEKFFLVNNEAIRSIGDSISRSFEKQRQPLFLYTDSPSESDESGPRIELKKQICSLFSIDPSLVSAMQSEMLSVDIPWARAFDEYQNGNWWTVPLINADGDYMRNSLEDSHGSALPTAVLRQLPITYKFLASLGFRYQCVRAAKLAPGGYLYEHSDYSEKGYQSNVIRLHIPINTNDNAYMVLNGHKVFLRTGTVWCLNPKKNHAVINDGVTDRIHLVADCFIDDKLREFMEASTLDISNIQSLPELSSGILAQATLSALKIYLSHSDKSTVAALDGFYPWELPFTKLYHHYRLGSESNNTYRILQNFSSLIGDYKREEYWKLMEAHFLPRLDS